MNITLIVTLLNNHKKQNLLVFNIYIMYKQDDLLLNNIDSHFIIVLHYSLSTLLCPSYFSVDLILFSINRRKIDVEKEDTLVELKLIHSKLIKMPKNDYVY